MYIYACKKQTCIKSLCPLTSGGGRVVIMYDKVNIFAFGVYNFKQVNFPCAIAGPKFAQGIIECR